MIGGDIITLRTENNDLAEQEFQQKFPQYKIKKIGKELKIEAEKGDEFLPLLVKALSTKIISITLRRPTLEDVFLELTGRQIRDNNNKLEVEEPLFDLSNLFSLFIPPNQDEEQKNKNQSE